MRKLRKLQAHSIFITDAGIRSIVKLSELRSLDLEGARLTDDGLKLIATLPELKNLELESCVITDARLEHLRGMKLEELNLRNTQITNRSIEGLKQMKALRRLEVNNTGVTEAACAQLIKEIPDLKVWGRDGRRSTWCPTIPRKWV